LKPHRLVYYLFDDFAGALHDDPLLRDAHNRLVERADLIVATTAGIARSLLGSASVRASVLPNGVDSKLIASLADRAEPAFLRGIPTPRITYTGVVNIKIDLELISRLATSRPEWQWVFVGPVKIPKNVPPDLESYNSSLQGLMRTKNVHFVGEQPFPDYLVGLHHSTVNVICHRESGGWWVNGYPLKFHEYLATGKPVVSTPIECIANFESVARFASTDSQWLSALSDAIDNGGRGSPEARKAIARANDWNHLTTQFENWLLPLAASDTRAANPQESLHRAV
jgi:glycosyltransferase involved in cell wall biosynthesis